MRRQCPPASPGAVRRFESLDDFATVEAEDRDVNRLPRLFDGADEGSHPGVRLNDELHCESFSTSTLLSKKLASSSIGVDVTAPKTGSARRRSPGQACRWST